MKMSSWSARSGLFYKPANVGISTVGWRTVSVLLLFWFDSAFFRARYSRCLLFISCRCSSDISAQLRYSRCLLFISCRCSSDISARCFFCLMFLSSLLRSASSKAPDCKTYTHGRQSEFNIHMVHKQDAIHGNRVHV